jgi:L-alanine-DL-glutamate epimerase-like enolase superfamily enzyme
MPAVGRITRATIFLVNIPLRMKVEHALASRHANTTGFLVLESSDGAAGIGEFLARDYVTGDTVDACVTALRDLGTRLTGIAATDPVSAIHDMWTAMPDRPGRIGALGAVDMALLDLCGKVSGRPAAELMNRTPRASVDSLAFSATYPLARGVKLAALHLFYRTWLRMAQVKVKGTGDLNTDRRYVRIIRGAFHYPVHVRVDLNGSLRPDAAEEYFARMLEPGCDVQWFEQPFPKNDFDNAARFQRQFEGDVVLCADESVCTIEDLERTIRAQAFRAVNIRIAKHGGLLRALEIHDRAAVAGLQTQLGCLVGESSVLAHAGLHLAALAGDFRFHEGCFGRYLIRWDVLRPSLRFGRHGRVRPASLPARGLVPRFDLDRLRRAATQIVPLGSSG